MVKTTSQLLTLFLTALVVATVFVFYWHSDNALSQDLGRHIRLGEIIVREKSIPRTNLFSFTNASFSFSNHHWLSEVIFYGVHRLSGFAGLFALKFFLGTTSIVLVLFAIVPKRFHVAAFFILPVGLFILFNRPDLRPEMFGYLFFAVFLYAWLVPKKIAAWFYLLPAVLGLWVNMHITFVFGVLMAALMLLKYERRFIPVAMLCGFALLLNPQGIAGVLYPFFIFNNYGYAIAENQTVFFLARLGVKQATVLIWLWPVALGAAGYYLWKRQYAKTFILILLYVVSLWQIRHAPFFMLSALALFPEAFFAGAGALSKYIALPALHTRLVLIVLYSGIVAVLASNTIYNTLDMNMRIGAYFNDPYKNAMQFVKQAKFQRRVLNNFDIGGYMVYALYSERRVFVDNRPEAYPASFFEKVYIPLHTDYALREKIFKQYGITTVVYNHTDHTNWAGELLSTLLQDSSWKLAYLDAYALVLTRERGFPDIRRNGRYAQQLVEQQDFYLNNLQLYNFFSLAGEPNNALLALKRAEAQNPLSCATLRARAYRLSASSYTVEQMKALQIQKSAWFCF